MEKLFKVILAKDHGKNHRQARVFYKGEDISQSIISVNVSIGPRAMPLELRINPLFVELEIREG